MKNKKLLFLLTVIFFSITQYIYSQDGLVKSWEGTLVTGMGGKLRVVLNITQTDEGKMAASMDSPDQGAKGIPVDSIITHNNNIKLILSSIRGEYEGVIKEDFSEINGQWKQGGQTFKLQLKPLIKTSDGPVYFALWQGVLKAGEAKLKLIFKFYKTGGDSVAVHLDSPDQGAKNITASNVYYGGDSVYVAIGMVDGYFTGKFNAGKTMISGEWVQSGNRFPLTLEKITSIEKVKHPQEPQRPFPYNEEEVTIQNKIAGVTLAGTFIYPKDTGDSKGFPVVVLVTGSGPQTRDEEVFDHKPFLVWSDYLTRNGIAVLRYDDRGIGQSTGNFGSATTMDFTQDAIAAVDYLKNRKEINPKKIGIIGHSEGGLIAPLAANKCNDVSFIILAAGPAVPGDEIILLQSELILRKSGAPENEIQKAKESNRKIFDIIKSEKDSLNASEKIDAYFVDLNNSMPDSEKNNPENSKEGIARIKKRVLTPWFRQFITFNPGTELEKLHIPVLAMYGENDLQVPPVQNKDEMERRLRKSSSKNFKVVVFPKLNHIFQKSETGLPTEYATLEETASPKMLELMTGWIKEL